MAASSPRKASFSEPRSSPQAATSSQILPGDEIVQVNEQVVVSGGERAGSLEMRDTEGGRWQSGEVTRGSCEDQGCGSCLA